MTDSADNLKSILNGMDALIAVCTPEDGRILFLNDSIREFFGIESDGVGQICHKLLQGRDEPCPACPYQQLREEPDKIIVWDHTDEIKGRTLHKAARLIDWPGGKKAYLGYAIDVTDLMDVKGALEHRDNMLDALNSAAIALLSQNEETFVETMTEGIGFIADIAGIDRMSVSRNTKKPDGLYASQIFRWSKNAGSTLPLMEELIENSYDRHIPRWRDVLAAGECINGPVSLMPEADALQQFGCVTVLAIPVMNRGEFWGFVLFENLQEERLYDAGEVDILRSASLMLANAVIRNEEAQKVREADEYAKLMIEAMPLSCVLWNADHKAVDCNQVTVALHGFDSKLDCLSRLRETYPRYQPDGELSEPYARRMLNKAFVEGSSSFDWMNCELDGTPIPTHITMTRVHYGKYDYVVGYAQDLREHTRMVSEINRKNQLLEAVNQVSYAMLASTDDTFDDDLLRSMNIMADAVNADRVYVWKNQVINGELYCSQQHEWSGRAEPQQGNALTESVPFPPVWLSRLTANQCVNGIVKNFSSYERKHLQAQSVLSIIVVPIFLYNEFWGFVGFDDCHSERSFSKSEEAILRSASVLIAEALVRHDMAKNLQASAVELKYALTEAQSASRSKSEFLSSMSHEMRTPLNAVIGMTAIGLRSAEAERKNYALERIEEASTHLLGVINDILDMSKIESGKLELSPVEFNLEHMLQKVISVISYRVNEKHQQFTVNVDGNVPRFVIGDDQRLSQIITNLLANAVKFTPTDGDIHLGISLLGVDDGINEVRFEVADSGIGISAEQQAKLFQSFQQAESGISREYGGTGLGLAISKRLVEMMGGRIWVESEPGEGARFIFTAKMPNTAKNLRSLLRPGVNWESVRVLVVDSSPSARRQFKEAFDRLGVECATVEDSVAAHEMINEQTGFDVYFIDLHATGINGIGFTGWLRSRGERSAIILTSDSDWESLQEAVLRSGADKGLIKPILSSALIDCMNECLGNPNVNQAVDDTEEFAGKTLLLAEDIDINREIVVSLLADTGLNIDCAENGRDALTLMEANPNKYDMVFMDMQMPVMDGLEATRHIRALSPPWCKEIPIVAMTANVFKDDITNCIDAGMNDHIGKPVDFEEMMRKLRKYLLDIEYSQHKLRYEGRSSLALFRGDDRHTGNLTEGTKVSVDIRVLNEQGKRSVLSLPSIVEVYPDGFFLVQMPKYQSGYYPLPREEMFLIYFTIEAEKNAADMYVIPGAFYRKNRAR